MTSLHAYLNSPKAKKALSTKPGEEGFSLIELVIVVAVLAALSAIAIPSFNNISQKARATAAANTVATIVKECAVKYAEGETSPTFSPVSLQGYSTVFTAASATATSGSANACREDSGVITALSADPAVVPHFTYAFDTGVKTCTATANSAAVTGRGCTSGFW